MNKRNLLFAILGLFAGFSLGFFLANSAHRSLGTTGDVRSSKNMSRADGSANVNGDAKDPNAQPAELTDADIRDAIATADAKPKDIALQQKLGMSLYQYVGYTQNTKFLPEAARLLKRAYAANSEDRDLQIVLGHVLSDMGHTGKVESYVEARTYYLKALATQDDADVRTDLGSTYLFSEPSDPKRAIVEYRKSLALDPRHESTLENLAAALIATGNSSEAKTRIDELAGINPSNPALASLRSRLVQTQTPR